VENLPDGLEVQLAAVKDLFLREIKTRFADRLGYFWAIEITRRKFASTISFFARRAFAQCLIFRFQYL
jgi:hypothetical protein